MESTTHQTINYQVAEIQLSYKTNLLPSQMPQIERSKSAYDILLNSWDQNKLEFIEQFKVLLLNRANKVLGIFAVSSGCLTGTVADPKLIFTAAIKANACGIILSHNHPSGNLKPSQADIDLTKKMTQGGKFLEIQILDHIIVTKEGYFSFADEGLI
ncbi:MAG: JAB domain-containing protein [Cyclobacteriaceae bacterium]|nr:JAB domain-containing protein [Cyclobacteriaceae bacterium]